MNTLDTIICCSFCGEPWSIQRGKWAAGCDCGRPSRIGNLNFNMDDVEELKGGEICSTTKS